LLTPAGVTRLSGGRGGRNALEHELRRLGIRQKNGKPNHPQTQGKAERFQQTLKKWLAAQDPPPATLTKLQALLDAFTSSYNTSRPHKSLPGRVTPATAYATRPKATPGDRAGDTHDRPGVAADGLTQASQAGVRLLPPWQGGLVLTAWAIALTAAGTMATTRRDIT
jgi:hypothetical protein